MIRSDSITALASALSKAQGEIEPAAKDNINPHFRNKYADLASCWAACRAPLSKHGLSVVQPVSTDGALVSVTTLLLHSSGEWMSEVLVMTAQQNTPQGIGSTVTYGRRYGLCAMVGIAPDDDDGNLASQPDRGATIAEPRRVAPVLVNELPPADAPAGYDEWLIDLTAAADNGIVDFESAFGKSKMELRRHLTQTDVERYGNLRAKARRVGAPVTVKAPK